VKEKVEPTLCAQISTEIFRSIIHFDIGIYFFYKGQIQNAITHFQQQNLPTEDFPYLSIKREKLDGYLMGLGLLASGKKSPETESTEPKIVKIAKLIRRGDFPKLKVTMGHEFVLEDSFTPFGSPNVEDSKSVISSVIYRMLPIAWTCYIQKDLITLFVTPCGSHQL